MPRPSAVTIVAEARTANILDYDAFVTDWDEFLNITDSRASIILFPPPPHHIA